MMAADNSPISPTKAVDANVSTASSIEEDGQSQDFDRAEFLSQFTAEDEKRIMRKVDRHIVILAALIYAIKQVDTLNLSLVKVIAVGKPTNILTQLKMSVDEYTLVNTAYSIPYVVLETPMTLLLKRMGPRLFQTRIMITWGLVLACHAAIRNKTGLFVTRVILGVVEAGMFPAIMTSYLCWYRGDELARPMVWLHGIDQFTSILSSLLVYGISYLDGRRGLSSWQWTFLIEGVLTIAYGIVLYIWLPDYPKSPRSSKWLTPREQDFIEARLSKNNPRYSDKPFSWTETINTLKDLRLWSFTFYILCMSITSYGISWGQPTVIKNLGFVGVPRNLLLILPGSFLALCLIVATFLLYQNGRVHRPPYSLTIVALEIIAFAIFLATENKGARYAAVLLGTMFSHAWGTSYWPWRSSSISGTTGTAVAFGIQNSISQLGSIIGPQIFREKWEKDNYRQSFGIMVGCLGGGFLFGCLCWYLTFDLERETRRVKLERNAALKEGRILTSDEIHTGKVRKGIV